MKVELTITTTLVVEVENPPLDDRQLERPAIEWDSLFDALVDHQSASAEGFVKGCLQQCKSIGFVQMESAETAIRWDAWWAE